MFEVFKSLELLPRFTFVQGAFLSVYDVPSPVSDPSIIVKNMLMILMTIRPIRLPLQL